MKFDAVLKTLGLKEESKVQGFAKFVLKHWWLWILIAITVFSFWTRMLPAKYGELQALDPFYAYRITEYMVSHNLEIPEFDPMRYWPDGLGINKYGPLMYFYIPSIIYLVFQSVGISMSFLSFAIMYPALMGAVSVFFIFWIGKEAFGDEKAGLFAALFLATVPAYIARTSAGFYDKEATGGAFLLVAVFFFLRSYNKKSWKLSVISAFFVFLSMGSWGGSQIIIFIISLFIIIKLILNQYTEKMIKAPILPLLSAVITQRYFLGVSGISFEQILAIVTISFVLLRFAVERYKLVKEDNLPYFMPVVFILIIFSVIVGSMFSDYLFWLVENVIGLITVPEQGFIGTTVAEQMRGSWDEVTARTNISTSRSVIDFGQLEPLFSIWFLFIMGSIMIVYSIYSKKLCSKKQLLILFPLIWLLISIQTVFYMVRLVFFLGPPAALVAGYFISEMINRFSGLEYIKKKKGLKKLNPLSLLLIAVISLVVISNLAAGYVFCNSLGPSFNQYWADAMDYLKNETPVNSSVLSWWDFGYWFQTRGERPSTADGGNNNGTVDEQIADWFVSDSTNWTDYRWWYKGKDVSYILMDYTLPGKYGAISKIASEGKTITGMLQFQQTGIFPQQNRTIVEYRAGQYTIWIPISSNGNIAGNPIFMISQGDQYVGRNYIKDLCTTNGIVRLEAPEGADSIQGCVSIVPYGLFYIPPEAEFTIFTNLMFMDGYGIPDVKKVFDNQLIKIYELEINETQNS